MTGRSGGSSGFKMIRFALFRLIVSLFLSLSYVFFVGCQTTDLHTSLTQDQAADLSLDPATHGVLVGSFARYGKHPSSSGTEAGYQEYNFFFRNMVDADPKGHLRLRRRPFAGYPRDFELEEGSAQVFAIPLPAGAYEFYDFALSFDTGMAEYTWRARNHFSIPFNVEPGQVVYVGEVRSNHLWKRNLIGLFALDGATFSNSDQGHRDLPLLKERFPFIAAFTEKTVDLSSDFERVFPPR